MWQQKSECSLCLFLAFEFQNIQDLSEWQGLMVWIKYFGEDIMSQSKYPSSLFPTPPWDSDYWQAKSSSWKRKQTWQISYKRKLGGFKT